MDDIHEKNEAVDMPNDYVENPAIDASLAWMQQTFGSIVSRSRSSASAVSVDIYDDPKDNAKVRTPGAKDAPAPSSDVAAAASAFSATVDALEQKVSSTASALRSATVECDAAQERDEMTQLLATHQKTIRPLEKSIRRLRVELQKRFDEIQGMQGYAQHRSDVEKAYEKSQDDDLDISVDQYHAAKNAAVGRINDAIKASKPITAEANRLEQELQELIVKADQGLPVSSWNPNGSRSHFAALKSRILQLVQQKPANLNREGREAVANVQATLKEASAYLRELLTKKFGDLKERADKIAKDCQTLMVQVEQGNLPVESWSPSTNGKLWSAITRRVMECRELAGKAMSEEVKMPLDVHIDVRTVLLEKEGEIRQREDIIKSCSEQMAKMLAEVERIRARFEAVAKSATEFAANATAIGKDTTKSAVDRQSEWAALNRDWMPGLEWVDYCVSVAPLHSSVAEMEQAMSSTLLQGAKSSPPKIFTDLMAKYGEMTAASGRAINQRSVAQQAIADYDHIVWGAEDNDEFEVQSTIGEPLGERELEDDEFEIGSTMGDPDYLDDLDGNDGVAEGATPTGGGDEDDEAGVERVNIVEAKTFFAALGDEMNEQLTRAKKQLAALEGLPKALKMAKDRAVKDGTKMDYDHFQLELESPFEGSSPEWVLTYLRGDKFTKDCLQHEARMPKQCQVDNAEELKLANDAWKATLYLREDLIKRGKAIQHAYEVALFTIYGDEELGPDEETPGPNNDNAEGDTPKQKYDVDMAKTYFTGQVKKLQMFDGRVHEYKLSLKSAAQEMKERRKTKGPDLDEQAFEAAIEELCSSPERVDKRLATLCKKMDDQKDLFLSLEKDQVEAQEWTAANQELEASYALWASLQQSCEEYREYWDKQVALSQAFREADAYAETKGRAENLAQAFQDNEAWAKQQKTKLALAYNDIEKQIKFAKGVEKQLKEGKQDAGQKLLAELEKIIDKKGANWPELAFLENATFTSKLAECNGQIKLVPKEDEANAHAALGKVMKDCNLLYDRFGEKVEEFRKRYNGIRQVL